MSTRPTVCLNSALISGLMLIIVLASQAASVSSPRFEFINHGTVPVETMNSVRAALLAHYPVILDDLGVDSLPPIQVHVWKDRQEFYAQLDGDSAAHVERAMGYMVDEGGSISIRLLDDGGDLARRAVHELTHIATLQLNPEIADQARWLWEAVALFQSNEFYPPTQISCITLSSIPSLSSLNEDSAIYRVGYLLGEFIIERYGKAGLRSLVDRGGDTKQALDEPATAFERAWHNHVVSRYLENRLPPILSAAQIRQQIVGNTFYLADGRNLYFSPNRTVYMEMGNLQQSGRWYVRDGIRMCWRILNFEEFCASFRMRGDKFWLDTPSDCSRYALRRSKGDSEAYHSRF